MPNTSPIAVTLSVARPNISHPRSLWTKDIVKASTGGRWASSFTRCSQGKFLFALTLVRYPPFYDTNPYEIYKAIAIGYYEFPANVVMAGRSLIAGLLEQDVSKRLGCLSGGAEDIKNNNWFSGVDWSIVK